MAKMNTRSSPAKNPDHNSPLKSQGVTKNPSMQLCRFTDPEVDQLRSCFHDGTIFRPFDSSTKSDCVSDTWITFPAAPFKIGFTYPFTVLTQSFFTLTGLCYIQAMLMVWRLLYTLEHIIEQEGIDIGMSELSQLYNLVSHGSYRYLFKSKPQKPLPILKTTKNDTNWRNQFFFVRRDSTPNGNQLPKKWNTDAISLSYIQKSPVTEERVKAFWKLDHAIRTFPLKSEDPEEISSTSYTMSSAGKSSKSASRFSVSDLQEYASSRSIKKELAASSSIPEPKGMSTRGKGANKWKTAEPTEGLPTRFKSTSPR
ncbi:hypothetical protein Hdeb2414_s0010g00341721 [Helianthus debilis subsp. tardiflorus]